LPLLGVSVAVGRWFLPGEDGKTAQHLAVLSHEVWQTRFGGDTSIVGRTVRVDDEAFTVVGIMPRGFSLTGKPTHRPRPVTADVWLPFGVAPNMLVPGNHTMELVARLRPGVSIDAALADAEPLLRGQRSTARRGAVVVPRADVETTEVRRPLILLFASVG